MPEDPVRSTIYDSLGPIRVAFVGRVKALKGAISTESGCLREQAQSAFNALRRAPNDVEVVVNRQVHSARVNDVSAAPEDADGLFGDDQTRALCVFTADCVPVLLGDPQSGTVGAVHAGWRGLAEGIIGEGVTWFKRPSRLVAWIGPSIGPCCYEVSEEVAARVAKRSGSGIVVPAPQEAAPQPNSGRYPFLDLVGAATAQLHLAGVETIRVHKVCTRCSSEWHSYRREGPGQGRNHAFIWAE